MSDDKEVAEDYRQQRQESQAKKLGQEPRTREQQLQWMDDNRKLILEFIRRVAGTLGDEDKILAEYNHAVKMTSEGSQFDDVNARQILERVLKEVEQVCAVNKISFRGGVAFGVALGGGLNLSQRAVLKTESSIIEATLPFLAFCNFVSKAVARTLPKVVKGGFVEVCNVPSEVGRALQSSPTLVAEWAAIIGAYAQGSSPRDVDIAMTDIPTLSIHVQILRSIEIFAMAHEYGHHVFEHGIAKTSEETGDSFLEEHEADVFGRAVSMAVGEGERPPNQYAVSGAGAVVILGALDLIRRATAVLRTGIDSAVPRKRHPPFADRIKFIASLDRQLPELQRGPAAIQRECFIQIMELVWEAILPEIRRRHAAGDRPLDEALDTGGWLPV
ncbi:MAG TPA: hypothetical protein VH206_17495 [Xanthobacteraceae bacterium]|jgi:hypothetical protein|nr:hypothetical protein [Xanthobacteraceae bacterium]